MDARDGRMARTGDGSARGPARMDAPIVVRLLQVIRGLILRNRTRPGDRVYVTWSTLARATGVSEKTVARRMRAMERAGLVEIERRSGHPAFVDITAAGYALPGKGGASRPAPGMLRGPITDSGPDTGDTVSKGAGTGCPPTGDRMSDNEGDRGKNREHPLPSDLLSKLASAYPGAARDGNLAELAHHPWKLQGATIASMVRNPDRVKWNARSYAATIGEANARGDRTQLALSYDPPDYDPFRHGRRRQSRNQHL